MERRGESDRILCIQDAKPAQTSHVQLHAHYINNDLKHYDAVSFTMLMLCYSIAFGYLAYVRQWHLSQTYQFLNLKPLEFEISVEPAEIRNSHTVLTGILDSSRTSQVFQIPVKKQRIPSWAEEHAVKAKGQAGFRIDFRTTHHIFIFRSLIDKQKQIRKQGNVASCTAALLTSERRLILYLVLCCGRC